jgi:hypothetical protein
MAIAKQAFYEGAALHLVARADGMRSIRYEAPFFIFNDLLKVSLKYSTNKRSPWGFTFTVDEQETLTKNRSGQPMILGLVCGADGVAALPYEAYLRVASPRDLAIRISCYRQHGEHYEIKGPDGILDGKVPPGAWQKILRC